MDIEINININRDTNNTDNSNGDGREFICDGNTDSEYSNNSNNNDDNDDNDNDNNNNNENNNSSTGIDNYLNDTKYGEPILEIIESEYNDIVDKEDPFTSKYYVIVDKDTWDIIKQEMNYINKNTFSSDDEIEYKHISIYYNENYDHQKISIRDGFEEVDSIILV